MHTHNKMLQLNFNPFPVLETVRLRLRALDKETDTDALFEMRTSEDVMLYIKKPLQNRDEVRQMVERVNNDHLNNEAISWGITLKEDDKVIGTIGFWRVDKAHHRAEIGYMLHPAYWRKGILNEALGCVMQFGFDTMGLHSIEGHTDPRNRASQSVLLKHGFVQEAYFKENYFFKGLFYDTVVFSKLKPAQ
jgi:ribosomal-protein-alanine N-acetyltransferase